MHSFELEWPKQAEERVRSIKTILGYSYSTSEYKYAYGLVSSSTKGINIADVSIFGTIHIISGGNKDVSPPSSSSNFSIMKLFPIITTT